MREYEIRRAEEERERELEARVKRLKEAELQRLTEHRFARLDYLLSLTPSEFEDAIAEMYRRIGYEVKQTPYSNDRGYDAEISKEGETFLVECKEYDPSRRIGRPQLQKLFAAVSEKRAAAGICVATCAYASTAKEYA